MCQVADQEGRGASCPTVGRLPKMSSPRPERHDGERQDDHQARADAPCREATCGTRTETIAAGTMSEIVQVVEVRILAEGQADAAGEHRLLAGRGLVRIGDPTRTRDRVGRLETLVRETADVA